MADVAVVAVWNAVNAPPLSETNTLNDVILLAPAPGVPLQLTVKLVVRVVAGSEPTVLAGGPATVVVVCALVGVV